MQLGADHAAGIGGLHPPESAGFAPGQKVSDRLRRGPEIARRRKGRRLQLALKGDAGEELSALTSDLSASLSRLQETLADIQVIFDDAENAFDELQLPVEAAEEDE